MYLCHGVSTDQLIFRTILARIFNIFKAALNQWTKPTDLKMVLESLSNNGGDGYTKTSVKKCVLAALNFITLIPSRSIHQMLANFSGVEF